MQPVDSYVVFAEVVDHNSFTAAASHLNISKSTASKHVAELEDALGVRLLNRTTRTMSLTEAGAAVYEHCRQIVERLDAVRVELEQLSEQPRGVLRVNAPMTFGLMHLSPLVAPFCDRHPAVSVDLQLDDRRIDLVEGGFDVGVRVTTELTRFSLRARRLADSRRVLCATPEYLEAHGTPLTPRDLADHACINYTYLSTGNRWTFASSEGEQRVKVTGPVKSNSSIVIKDAVLGHQGIAQFPAFAVTGELSEGRLVSLLEDWPMPALHVFALYPETRHVPRKVRAFIDFLAERFGDVEW